MWKKTTNPYRSWANQIDCKNAMKNGFPVKHSHNTHSLWWVWWNYQWKNTKLAFERILEQQKLCSFPKYSFVINIERSHVSPGPCKSFARKLMYIALKMVKWIAFLKLICVNVYTFIPYSIQLKMQASSSTVRIHEYCSKCGSFKQGSVLMPK